MGLSSQRAGEWICLRPGFRDAWGLEQTQGDWREVSRQGLMLTLHGDKEILEVQSRPSGIPVGTALGSWHTTARKLLAITWRA